MFIHTITYLQMALLSVFTTFAPPDVEAPENEDIQALMSRNCSASSDSSYTGRQWAVVYQSSTDPDICIRELKGGEAPVYVPSCYKFRGVLGCSKIITFRPN